MSSSMKLILGCVNAFAPIFSPEKIKSLGEHLYQIQKFKLLRWKGSNIILSHNQFNTKAIQKYF